MDKIEDLKKQYQELFSRFEQATNLFNIMVDALIIPDEDDLDGIEKTEAMLDQIKVCENIILILKNEMIEVNEKIKAMYPDDFTP